MAYNPHHDIFLAHRPELLAYLANRLRDVARAQDVLQDLFIRFVEHANTGEIQDTRAYLFSMARNLCYDAQQKELRSPVEFVGDDDSIANAVDNAPGPEQIVQGRESLRKLVATMSQLPWLTQQVFVLGRIHDLTYQEIASELNVSVNTVQRHLAQAIAHAVKFKRQQENVVDRAELCNQSARFRPQNSLH
ncbi:RNA polymerase sigma factor [Pseudomonas aeruginosa]|uniref:RNA polymerase sigma factor n=1 Tax=Pseudomonas aeruginosa TaxID=287 RepID=UPI000F7DFE03|nr:sigma-70 family RNA polymerase sigma factor [Pseudomonas aeruginosa]RTB44108.1 sigma-70 family RNA polymerase sigma factor [Pseudomonas aeruginosa]